MRRHKLLRKSQSKLFICEICQTVILHWLPKMLKGKFVHIHCKYKDNDRILEATHFS